MTNERALAEFINEKAKLNALLKRLQNASDDHFFTSPDDVNYGHVGDLQQLKFALQELTSRVYREGEYAPENAA